MIEAKSKQIAINAIGQISVTVKDIDKAVTFYRDVLGMNLLFQVPNPAMAFFDVGGIRLMLAVPTSAEHDHPASVIYYKVDDIHAMHKHLLDKGVTFDQNPHSVGQTPTHDIWMAFFRDVDNNTLSIMSEIPLDQTKKEA